MKGSLATRAYAYLFPWKPAKGRLKFVAPPTGLPAVPWTALKAGDLLLTHDDEHWYSGAIQDATGYFASHVFSAAEDASGNVFGVEMTSPKAVNTFPLKARLDQEKAVYCCRLKKALTTGQSAAYWNFWKGLAGTGYGYAVLGTILVPTLWQRFATWLGLPEQMRRIPILAFGRVCSTSVAEGWKRAGLSPSDVNGEDPRDCANERFVGPLEKVTL